MDKQKLKLAMVGCGAVADYRHIPSFKRVKDKVTLYAACDRNMSLAASLAEKHKFYVTYADVTEMLKREKIDIVDICTPPSTHADIAIQAMNAGCHVLIEKPMAMTVDECTRMINTSKATGKNLCIVHNVLFHRPLLEAKERILNGEIGDFRGMRILLADPKNEMIMRKDYWIHKLPGGVIGETGPHPIYISLAFLDGIDDVEVFAESHLDHPWAKFDEFRIEFTGKGGMSSVMISYSGERYAAEIELFGSNGAFYVDLQSMLLYKYGSKGDLRIPTLVKTTLNSVCQALDGIANNGIDVMLGRFKVGHDVVVERFVNSIINGTESPVTGEQGRDVIRVLNKLTDRLAEKYK